MSFIGSLVGTNPIRTDSKSNKSTCLKFIIVNIYVNHLYGT